MAQSGAKFNHVTLGGESSKFRKQCSLYCLEEKEWNTREDDGVAKSSDDCSGFVGAEDVNGDRSCVHERGCEQ